MLLRVSMLIGEIFRRNAAVVPDRVAASLGTASLTHGELDAQGNRLAAVLRELGLQRGDRVVSCAETRLDVLPLKLLAAARDA